MNESFLALTDLKITFILIKWLNLYVPCWLYTELEILECLWSWQIFLLLIVLTVAWKQWQPKQQMLFLQYIVICNATYFHCPILGLWICTIVSYNSKVSKFICFYLSIISISKKYTSTLCRLYFATAEVTFMFSLSFWKLGLAFYLEYLCQFFINFNNQWQFWNPLDKQISNLYLIFEFAEELTMKKMKTKLFFEKYQLSSTSNKMELLQSQVD